MDCELRVPFVGMPDDVRAFMRGHPHASLGKIICFPNSSIVSYITVQVNHEYLQAIVDDWTRNYMPQ